MSELRHVALQCIGHITLRHTTPRHTTLHYTLHNQTISHIDASARGKLQLSDLLSNTTPTAHRAARVLAKSSAPAASSARRHVAGRLAAPLPKRVQDRLSREAAYSHAKQAISEWQPTVNKNR